MDKKVLIIGLDSADPKLVFEEFLELMPNMRMLVSNGAYGKLRSSIPPITTPAWVVMATGKSPGKLGLYGFRHRKNYSYTDIWIASSYAVKEPALWEILSNAGKKVCLVGVPHTYPPKPVNGYLVSDFITPDATKEYTYPKELKKEIEKLVGEYIFDVMFRSDEKDKVLEEIYEMTEKRFEVVKYLIQTKKWDLFWLVEIGLDRIHHAFWKYYDKEHHKHVPNSKYRDVIKNYYVYLDKKIGELLSLVDKNTIIIIVSDHGAKRMKGALVINEFLAREGYLIFKEKPDKPIKWSAAKIDWSKTKAWGWGGYYARIFLNVKGREEQGIIEPYEYEAVRDELAIKIKNLYGPSGEQMDNKVYKPEQIYEVCRGDIPDLMVFFDNLYWRSAGTVGYDRIYLPENDTGPDDSVHDWDGIFVFYDPKQKIGKELSNMKLLDFAPTVLNLFNVPIPTDMDGKVMKIKE